MLNPINLMRSKLHLDAQINEFDQLDEMDVILWPCETLTKTDWA